MTLDLNNLITPRIQTRCAVDDRTIEALSLLVGLACTEKTPR